MGLMSTYGVEAFARVITETNADLGDWLCQIMGICA